MMVTESSWYKPALKAAFHQGLSNIILTELLCQDNETILDSLIKLAICLTNLLQDCH